VFFFCLQNIQSIFNIAQPTFNINKVEIYKTNYKPIREMPKITKQFHFFLVIIPFFFLSLNSFAQQRINNVTGKATANTGEVIQGVSVNVEGTEKGTITDTSGVYKIKDVADAATRVINYVGFTTRRV
jgi:hypothetical protein